MFCNDEELLSKVAELAVRAGDETLRVYYSDFESEKKDDQSPVTEADKLSNNIIVSGLSSLSENMLCISEEGDFLDSSDLPNLFWLVDPLDGTKEFINKNGEFTVNIALIKNGSPVLGVVYAPALGVMYAGHESLGAFKLHNHCKSTIRCRLPNKGSIVCVSSRSHAGGEDFTNLFKTMNIVEQKSVGSSLKLCLVAAGEADVYPRMGRTMEWDIAAGDAILRASGGGVYSLEGELMKYGKNNFENPYFLAIGSRNISEWR